MSSTKSEIHRNSPMYTAKQINVRSTQPQITTNYMDIELETGNEQISLFIKIILFTDQTCNYVGLYSARRLGINGHSVAIIDLS